MVGCKRLWHHLGERNVLQRAEAELVSAAACLQMGSIDWTGGSRDVAYRQARSSVRTAQLALLLHCITHRVVQ